MPETSAASTAGLSIGASVGLVADERNRLFRRRAERRRLEAEEGRDRLPGGGSAGLVDLLVSTAGDGAERVPERQQPDAGGGVDGAVMLGQILTARKSLLRSHPRARATLAGVVYD